MGETLINLSTLIDTHIKLTVHIGDLKKTLQGLRGNTTEWRRKIEDDARPTVRLLHKELCKAEANLVGLEQLSFEVGDSDLKFLSMIKESLEV